MTGFPGPLRSWKVSPPNTTNPERKGAVNDVTAGPAETSSPMPAAGSGLPENMAGALAYVLGPITGILFFILDRQRPTIVCTFCNK